ncbi:MAG TPA: nitrile hydratase subunit alpha [Dehalococcoidia bacterium]|jgi:hypothetical protein|nr:nitrile hydratase subunit alpha [Dehalococcoidia bacterium]
MSGAEASQVQAERYNAVLARAWTEPDYRARLLAEPAQVLGEAGIELPSGKSVRVVEIGPDEVYVVLPEKLDAESRARLREAPESALAAAGVETSGGRRLQLLEEDETHGYVFIPSRPEKLQPGASADEVQGYMNIFGASQNNLGFFTGAQTNALVAMQSGGLLNMANVTQNNFGIGTGSQTNAAVVMQQGQ